MAKVWTGNGKGWGGGAATIGRVIPAAPNMTSPVQSVIDAGPWHYSASQIAKFRYCRRKWALRYIAGLPDKSTAYANLGKYIHTVLEQYLKDGSLPRGQGIAVTVTKPNGKEVDYTHDDIMDIILPGIKHLPTPGSHIETELKFSMDLGELGEIVGYIDFLVELDPLVGDHKTTSNLKWAHTKESLVEDVQCVIYAVYVLEKTGAYSVTCRWVYYQTTKPRGRKVEVDLTAEELQAPWAAVIQDIREMDAIRRSGIPADQVDYDSRACGAYGGCPYAGTACKLTTQEILGSYRKMPMSMKERLEAMKAKQAAQAPAAPAPAAPAAPAPAAPAPAAEPVAVNPPEGNAALEALKARAAAQAQAAPPAQAPVELPPPEVIPPPAQVQSVTPQQAQEALIQTLPQPAPQVVAQPAPVATPQAAVQAAPAAVAPVPTQAEATAAPTPAKKTRKAKWTLYIDCAPNSPYQDFAEVAAPVLESIKQEHGVHYRLVDGLYGGNAALFSEAMAAYLEANPPKKSLVVTLSSPAVKDCIEALVAAAGTVVRAFQAG